jgi:PEGA domain-containing protein
MSRFPALLLPLVFACGCIGVRRELTIESEPAGAVVYLNGDEVGRTPLTREFNYYGTADVKLRKDGYETLEDRPRVWAPWWQVPPLDLVTESMSLTDRHRLSYELTPKEVGPDLQELVQRGVELRGELESSEAAPK